MGSGRHEKSHKPENLVEGHLYMKIIHTKSFHYRFDTEEIGDTPDEEHERDACL